MGILSEIYFGLNDDIQVYEDKSINKNNDTNENIYITLVDRIAQECINRNTANNVIRVKDRWKK